MSTTTKERPILFSGPMVRAILAGRKTQTRRIIKPQYDGDRLIGPEWYEPGIEGKDGELREGKPVFGVYDEHGEFGTKCPYGAPGDRLWVRETWTPDHAAFYPHFPYVYRADAGHDYERNEKGETYSPEAKAWYPYRWRPSIHMPRAASRITLEITGVRVERLHEISREDAIAEGIESSGRQRNVWRDYLDQAQGLVNPINSFCSLWRMINGPGSWTENPWVWVVGFKKVEA